MKTSVGKVLLVAVIGLAVCAVMQSAILSAKDPVTRPFQVTSQITFLDVLGGPPLTMIDQGVCSHLGKCTGFGKYIGNTGFGITYAANGDQIFWKDDGSGVIQFTGGTGRFQGATGGFTFSVLSSDYVPGPEGTLSWVFTYTGEGTITY